MSVVRLAFADQHGVLRGKTFAASEIDAALKNGVGFSATMPSKDTAHRTVFPVWQPGAGFGMKELEGAADVVMLPDPATFRALPWAPHSGWMLCDICFTDGRPMPLDTRQIYKRALKTLADRGYDFIAGLEVEFHLFKLEKSRLGLGDAGQPGQPGEPPECRLLNHGYQYLTELRYDELDPILDILRTNIVDLGLPLRCIEVEFGPSQVEFTFRAGDGLGRPTPWCCCAAPSSRSPPATATTPPSCAARSSPRSCRAAGTCTRACCGTAVARQRLQESGPTAVAVRDRLPGRAAAARAGHERVLHADPQRLQALPLDVAGPRPRGVGARQPRGDGARAR